MNNERFKSTIAFTDLLFNILVGFAFLFIIAFLLIKPEAKKKDFDRKAEFVIVMDWDHESKGDIDLYVQDPMEDIVSYRMVRKNFMHLDKDDLGSANDTVVNADGSISTVSINRKVVTIRRVMNGVLIKPFTFEKKKFVTPTQPVSFSPTSEYGELSYGPPSNTYIEGQP